MANMLFNTNRNFFPMNGVPAYNAIDPQEDSLAVQRAKAQAQYNQANPAGGYWGNGGWALPQAQQQQQDDPQAELGALLATGNGGDGDVGAAQQWWLTNGGKAMGGGPWGFLGQLAGSYFLRP